MTFKVSGPSPSHPEAFRLRPYLFSPVQVCILSMSYRAIYSVRKVGPAFRDEIRAQEWITPWLPMSHRLIDPKQFLDVLNDQTLRKLKKVLQKAKFINLLKVGVLQTFKKCIGSINQCDIGG